MIKKIIKILLLILLITVVLISFIFIREINMDEVEKVNQEENYDITNVEKDSFGKNEQPEEVTNDSIEVKEEVIHEKTIKEQMQEVTYYVQENKEDYLKYYENNNNLELTQIIIDVNIGLDKPFYEEIGIANRAFQLDVLCNKYNALPEAFKPEDLVEIDKKYHINDGKEYLIDKRLLEAYMKIYEASKDDGINLEIASAYRSKDYQTYLYNKYKERHGKEKADTFSARPRHSEHETGLAIDFYPISNTFEDKKEFQWLMDNAHKYGFILRYPKGKKSITGYMYEPWHFRFVGKEIASIIKKEGITYDEYYAKYVLPKLY